MKKALKTWTDDKEEFLYSLKDGSYHITKDMKLFPEGVKDIGLFDEGDIIDSVHIFYGPVHHTTDRLRQFCAEFHPEIDFDAEFQTNEPGVFGRYQERFPEDNYGSWICEQIYAELIEALNEKGYTLEFEKGGD